MNRLAKDCLLTINGGSSSIKYALYEIRGTLDQLLSGEMEGIGTGKAKFSFIHLKSERKHHVDIPVADHAGAGHWLVRWLEKETDLIQVKAIGHRIVQGMEHTSPEKITNKLLTELKAFSAYDGYTADIDHPSPAECDH
jgi:acetate kinase